MAQSTTYRIILKDPSSGDQYELQPKSYSFTEELNKESNASFTFSFEDMDTIAQAYNTTVLSMFTASLMEIWIERLNTLGSFTKIFYGVITDFDLKPTGEGAREFTIKATSWFGLLAKRIAGVPSRVFSNTDAGTIAWTLISESQSSDNPYSDLGITQGTIDTSKNRDRTYRFDNIHDSIVALSNNNLKEGFDFEIDNTKVFNVYYPTKGSDLPNIVMDITKLATYSYRKPLILNLTNKVHVLGEGVNDDVLYQTRTASTTYRNTWKTLEEKLNESDVKQTSTLQDKGDGYLAYNQSPIIEFIVEHYDSDDFFTWFDYNVGDTLRVNFPDLDLSSASKRVIKKEFKMQADKSIGYVVTTFDLGTII